MRDNNRVTFLPAELYAQIEASVPIACVDFVPARVDASGARQIGLIVRDSPHGRVWCHLGGRVQRGETLHDAIGRHARDTLGVEPVLPTNPQPDYVYEWFPPEIAPNDGTLFGDDPRKHAIGLSFVVQIDGAVTALNEALDFGWFSLDALPAPLWPGCETLLAALAPRLAH